MWEGVEGSVGEGEGNVGGWRGVWEGVEGV